MKALANVAVIFALACSLASAEDDPLRSELPLLRELRSQQEHCAGLNRELGPLSGFAKQGGWSIWGGSYYQKQHDLYRAKADASMRQDWFSDWKSKLGDEGAQALLAACVKSELPLKPLCEAIGKAYPGCALAEKARKNGSWLEGSEETVQNRIALLDLTDRALKGEVNEIRKESVYALKLKTYKSEFTADIGRHIANSINAQYNDVIVGEADYDKHYEGEVLSSRFNVVGLFKSDGEISSYKVAVAERKEIPTFMVVRKDGTVEKINESVYGALVKELGTRAAPLQRTDFSGVHGLVLLGQPKNRTRIVKVEPKTRYFVNVQIKNSTFTADLGRQLQNYLTANEVEFEVPKETFENQSSAFNPDFNGAAVFTKGSFNTLHGNIISRRRAEDKNYVEATLSDGRKLTLPKKDLAEYQLPGQLGAGPADEAGAAGESGSAQ